MQQRISRTTFVAAAAATTLASVAFIRTPSRAAEVSVKIATDLEPTHPTVVHLQSAADAIGKDSSGAIDVKIFPSNQLGNDDQMLSQVRSGALEIMAIGDNILAQLVPATASQQHRFRLEGSQGRVRRRSTAHLGDYVRERDRQARPLRVREDLGRRLPRDDLEHAADSHARRSRRLQDARPAEPDLESLMRDLGASPTTINYADLYRRCRRNVVDGQENPLVEHRDAASSTKSRSTVR